MWLPKTDATTKGTRSGSVAIAIDNDKTSQNALKWTMENLTSRGQTLALIHVVPKSQSSSDIEEGITHKQQIEKETKHLFVSFHCFCSRKEINCLDVVLEDVDKVKAIVEYVTVSAIENLVLGAPSRNSFMRRFKTDLPTSVSKAAPDFCNVYVIAKSKISSLRSSSRPAPYHPSVLSEFDNHETTENKHKTREATTPAYSRGRRSVDSDGPRSGFVKPPQGHMKLMGDFSDSESEYSFINASQQGSDISYISSGRPSVDRSSFTYDLPDSARTSRMSTSSEQSIGSNRLGIKFTDLGFLNNASTASEESGRTSCSYSSQSLGDVEAQMRRLRLELKQTMDMYSSACREALTARNEATELQRLRSEEERRMEELKMTEETAMSMVEKERAKARTATEAAEAAHRLAEAEAKRRLNAEMKVLKENDSFPRHSIVRYRKYSVQEIEEGTGNFAESRKVGEGGYGPVFRGHLDHTSVAVKVLRPDAAQGRSQFHKEVEVLSCIRHPNMVLLLGACPEYGILVYEYMAKGSLDDRLFRRGNTPAISWQLRFRIAAEIATGLLFLHQTKPEPIVHRDLKPGNVLLDHNYVSKISDVGLARLVPAVAENVTQCRATSAAGTFCYIDPEYQQTGMLGVKSDVYSLGIMLLQLLTAKQPMGLAYYVEQAVEEGKLIDMLDPAVPDWPLEEAMSLAKLSLQCAELRRKDRPDLGKEVMPVLNRLREMGEESLESVYYAGHGPMSHSSQVSYTSLRGTKMGQGKEVKTRPDPQVEIQERGEIFFFYRPKVNKEEAHSVDDVQRLYIVMRPESGENPVEEKQDPLSGKEGSGDEDENNSSKKGGEGGHGVEKVNIEKQILLRFIVMGKKTLPDPSKKSQPFWGFVEMVTKKVEDVKEALKGEEYQTKTRGHRHNPPARAVGEGIYRILRHKPYPTRKHHTHLVYKLEYPSPTEKHEPQESMNIEPEGSFLIQVRNPEQGKGGRGSGFRGLKRKRKAQFPAHLQAHLGHTRFGAADPPDFLNYEGCEFLLISASDDIEKELGVELESGANANAAEETKSEQSQTGAKQKPKKLPTATELISHYQKRGLEPAEASVKVVEDLQNALVRVVSSSKNNASSKDKLLTDARKIDAINGRLAVVDAKLETKPGYVETFVLGLASGAALNGINAVWPHVTRGIGQVWSTVKSGTDPSSAS
ncbi:unnamed protein product [Brassica napus]|uniref:RING-type E3 ubiquitin transferase n=1 Tax=Brassica napus TaxID=3708 RepID=A0A817AFN1_BRANA|nr:unnamed protein product [Brassica napus]